MTKHVLYLKEKKQTKKTFGLIKGIDQIINKNPNKKHFNNFI